MTILALDTSHKRGSLCLKIDQAKPYSIEWENERSHAEFVIEKIQETLKKNNISLIDIDHYCVGIGPGSFTGIRIAINVIKTFAYTFSKPVLVQNSLDIIASSCGPETKPLLVAINAHSQLCYCAEYKYDGCWTRTSDIKTDTVGNIVSFLKKNDALLVGDAYEFYKTSFPHDLKIQKPKEYSDVPQAQHLMLLCLKNLNNREIHRSWQNLEPFYVRVSAPEEKLMATKLDQSARRK